MSAIHHHYARHLTAVHNGYRNEMKSVIHHLPNATQPAALKTALRNVLNFCQHLQTHHDLEEAIVFPSFAAVTDISHWSHSHEELDHTLDAIRQLARKGIAQEGKEFDGEKQELIDHLNNLSDIVLPHLQDEEDMSAPEETIKLWPTEQAMRRAFPWMG